MKPFLQKAGTIFAGLFLVGAILILSGCPRREEARKAAAETARVTIRVATDATWPPMQFVNENREIVGFDIDLMNAIAEAAGFDVVIQNTAWDGIFAGLANEKYDAIISSVTITEERRATMDFSEPYLNAGQVLIVPKGTQNVTTLADLTGKAVGAQIGTTGAMEIQKVPGVTLRSYDELGLAIEDLVNGRIAGVVADTPIASDFVLQNKTYQGKLKIVGEPFTQEYYGIVVRKGNTRVLDLMNTGLRKVKESGKLQELENRWLWGR